jgi:hypothetical protein
MPPTDPAGEGTPLGAVMGRQAIWPGRGPASSPIRAPPMRRSHHGLDGVDEGDELLGMRSRGEVPGPGNHMQPSVR